MIPGRRQRSRPLTHASPSRSPTPQTDPLLRRRGAWVVGHRYQTVIGVSLGAFARYAGGRPGQRLLYRRRNAAPSAGVPNSHMLSATLIVTPGGDDFVDAVERVV